MRGIALMSVCLSVVGCDDRAPAATQTPSTTQAVASAQPTPSAAVHDSPEAALVRKQLEAYSAAVYAKDGEGAAKLASKRTLDYFDRARKLALFASAESLAGMPMFDQMMVLNLRARVAVEEIDKADGTALFARGVREGWTGAVARNFAAGPIVIEGDTAVVMSRAKPWLKEEPDKGFRAYREDGAWKLDVVAVASLAVVRMEAQLAKLDPNPQRALVKLTEKIMGKKLPDDIWDAPRKE
jgi:hypothetical protein